MQYPGELHEAFAALDRLPRVRLAGTVTPLETMRNLSARAGGAALVVKRDDLTPLAMGGNKVRQLEFILGDAMAKRADTVLITGAVQSNYVRLAAAASRRLGLSCHVQLEARVDRDDPAYRESGNVLLDRLLGATIHRYHDGEDEAGADRRLDEIAAGLADEGRRPYVIHLGQGHPSLGALGYVDAARELVGQVESVGLDVSRVVTASGSGATHAGLLFGLRLLGVPTPVAGACVRRDAERQRARIAAHCDSLSQLLGVDNPVKDGDIVTDDRFFAPGYGLAGEAAREAIRLAAHAEGLIVDPVYTAKSLALAIDAARATSAGGAVLFLHTGGVPAIFAYPDDVLAAVGNDGQAGHR